MRTFLFALLLAAAVPAQAFMTPFNLLLPSGAVVTTWNGKPALVWAQTQPHLGMLARFGDPFIRGLIPVELHIEAIALWDSPNACAPRMAMLDQTGGSKLPGLTGPFGLLGQGMTIFPHAPTPWLGWHAAPYGDFEWHVKFLQPVTCGSLVPYYVVVATVRFG